jgi:hypothetical protein
MNPAGVYGNRSFAFRVRECAKDESWDIGQYYTS